jgi:hypothetical protein
VLAPLMVHTSIEPALWLGAKQVILIVSWLANRSCSQRSAQQTPQDRTCQFPSIRLNQVLTGPAVGRRTIRQVPDSLRKGEPMPGPATLIVWFHLRSPELADEFEGVMAGDRGVDLGSLDTMSDWRLTRPMNVPGQPNEPADYVLIAEISEVDRWEQQASEQVQRLADDLAHLVSSYRMHVLERIL